MVKDLQDQKVPEVNSPESENGSTLWSRRRALRQGLQWGVGAIALGPVLGSSGGLAHAATLSSQVAAGPGVYNVRDYGARGNGQQDDTAAIQAAINAASRAGGGTVNIPAGTYPIRGIILQAEVDVVGDGPSSTILRFTQTTGNVISASRVAFVHVMRLQVQFAQRCTSGAGIYLDQCFTVGLFQVFIQGGPANAYDGIVSDQSTATHISHFTVSGAKHSGITVNGPNGNDVYVSNGIINMQQATSGSGLLINQFIHGAVNVTDCDILLGLNSLLVNNSNYLKIEDTYFDSSAQGALIESGHLIGFSNCWFSNRPGPGLTITNARGVNVVGGQAANCGGTGIIVGSGSNYVSLSGVQTICNNTVSGNNDGILVEGPNTDYVSIVGCASGNDKLMFGNGSQQVGIHIARSMTGCYTITANTLFNNLKHGIVADGRGEHKITANVGQE